MNIKKLFLAMLAMASLQANAKLTVTKLTCNYQSGLAVTEGDLRLGWQMTSDTNGDKQTAYQITVFENVTNNKVYNSGKVKSDQSQLIALPKLMPNAHGYYWQVRVWDAKGKASDISSRQDIRVVPASLGGKWIGAISKKAANLPEGRFSNSVFKKDEFKQKWANVDTLSAKSIIMRKEFTAKKRKVTDAVAYFLILYA